MDKNVGFPGVDPGFGYGVPNIFLFVFSDEVQSHAKEVSSNWPGSRACLRALEAHGFSLLNMHSHHFGAHVSISKKIFLVQILIYNA